MINFNTCCFCYPLRTGSLIIGYLSLVIGIGLAVISIESLIHVYYTIQNGLDDDMMSWILGPSSVQLILTLVFLAFTIVLLVGLHKEKPGHVKAFLIYATIFFVASVILIYVHIGMFYTEPLVIIGSIVWIVIYIYCLLVLRSYYMEMKMSF